MQTSAPGEKEPRTPLQPGVNWLKSSLAKKCLSKPAEEKLKTSQQRVLAAKTRLTTNILGYVRRTIAKKAKRGHPFPLVSVVKAVFGGLGPGVGSPVLET